MCLRRDGYNLPHCKGSLQCRRSRIFTLRLRGRVSDTPESGNGKTRTLRRKDHPLYFIMLNSKGTHVFVYCPHLFKNRYFMKGLNSIFFLGWFTVLKGSKVKCLLPFRGPNVSLTRECAIRLGSNGKTVKVRSHLDSRRTVLLPGPKALDSIG